MAAFLCRRRSIIAGAIGAVRRYCQATPSNLFRKLCGKDDPNISLVPDLDQWVADSSKVPIGQLKHAVHDLRKRGRFIQALEVTEWMIEKGVCKFTDADNAIQLDLIARVRGVKSAEKYLNSLTRGSEKEKVYGSLLNCYVRELNMDASLSHMQKMKKMGLASSPCPYNNIMSLYANLNQYEKIPEVLEEMKQNRVTPNNLSYNICINSYGARFDIEGVERTLDEMESQSHLTMAWDTYTAVANIYIKAQIPAKAISALKKAEEILAGTKYWEGYGQLIYMYGCLRKKDEVFRIWEILKKLCSKLIMKDYIVMFDSLAKLDEFEAAESLLKEWQKSEENFDFQVPNRLLALYCQKGMMEEGETLMKDMLRDLV